MSDQRSSKQPSISYDACYERLKAQRDRLAVENERLREYIARTAVSGGRQSEPPSGWRPTVRDGLVQRAGLYAPGLPDGDHDVFPVPLSPKGELRPHVLAEPPDAARCHADPIYCTPECRQKTCDHAWDFNYVPPQCAFGCGATLEALDAPAVTKSASEEHVCDGGWACHFHDVKKAAVETSEGQS